MLAITPFCSSSRITLAGLTLRRSASSFTVRAGGSATGPVATAVAVAALAAPLSRRSPPPRALRGPERLGRRGGRFLTATPFLYPRAGGNAPTRTGGNQASVD